jgi:hypothetical protein
MIRSANVHVGPIVAYDFADPVRSLLTSTGSQGISLSRYYDDSDLWRQWRPDVVDPALARGGAVGVTNPWNRFRRVLIQRVVALASSSRPQHLPPHQQARV